MSDKKVVIVTGASRGIGRAIAESLAKAGYLVVGTATGETGVQSITDALVSQYPDIVALPLKVDDDKSIEEFLELLAQRDLSPYALVNNAGITKDNLLMRMKDEEWQDVLTTNLTSIFKLSKKLIRPMMKARNGRIVNVGSVVGSIGNAGQANYAASKAGMIGFTKSLAREIANRGITVNAVAPGFFDTDMTKALSDDIRDQMLTQVPVGRLGRPEEIAAAIVFLLSDEAAYITGETLHINGGMHMA